MENATSNAESSRIWIIEWPTLGLCVTDFIHGPLLGKALVKRMTNSLRMLRLMHRVSIRLTSLGTRLSARRARRRMARVLGPDLAAPATLGRETHDEQAASPSAAIGGETVNYLRALSDPAIPIRVLIIGGFYDDLLEIWLTNLNPESIALGLDLESGLTKISDPSGLYVRMHGHCRDSLLKEVVAEYGPFDIIVDNERHRRAHLVGHFRYLFRSALDSGGVYVIGGVDCDYYLARYPGERTSLMDLVKTLADSVYIETEKLGNANNSKTAESDQRRGNPLPENTMLIGGVEIRESMVIVRRRGRSHE